MRVRWQVAVTVCGLSAGLAVLGGRPLTTSVRAAGRGAKHGLGSQGVERRGQPAKLLGRGQGHGRQDEPRWRHDHQDDGDTVVTFPHWTGSFSRDGVTYPSRPSSKASRDVRTDRISASSNRSSKA